MEAMGYCRIKKNDIMGKCRVGGEVHGKWKLLGICT